MVSRDSDTMTGRDRGSDAAPPRSGADLRWERTPAGLRLEGEVDLTNAHRLAEIVHEEQERLGDSVRLDLEALSFMDGAGVRALLEISRSLRDSGCLLVLASPGYIVRKALSVLTPDDLLDAIRIVES